MKQVIILKGLPASGKSTWSKQKVESEPGKWKHISKDDLRAMLDFGKWSKGNEKFVIKVRNELIHIALTNGYNVIVDDTNLYPKHEEDIRGEVEFYNDLGDGDGFAEVVIKDFTDVPVDECIKRDKKRENPVGEKVIRDMYNKYLKPEPPAPPEYDPSLPDCCVIDIDGTLAKMDGRSPYEWHRVGEDKINKSVEAIVRKFYTDPSYHVIFLTGRDGCCARETAEWLERFGYNINEPDSACYDAFLYHRCAGDTRKDSIVKRELYEKHIKGRYNVVFWLDDRTQVVRMVRDELGISCFQVDDGDF